MPSCTADRPVMLPLWSQVHPSRSPQAVCVVSAEGHFAGEREDAAVGSPALLGGSSEALEASVWGALGAGPCSLLLLYL